MRLLRRNRRQYLKVREDARRLVHARLAHYQPHYGVALRKVFIKNHKSRWGSCSQRGNLNFNYKILYLPPELQDYIIVHELCHLVEFNHSPAFWALVEQSSPKAKALRSELRRLERAVAK